MNKTKIIILGIIVLGLSSLITQVVYIREFLTIFSGNELVFGVLLANWLILTASGSFISKFVKFKENHHLNIIIIFQSIISVLPIIIITIFRVLKNQLFDFGVLLNISEIYIISFLMLLPYCILSGFLFPIYSKIISTQKNEIGKAYYFDTLGSIIGGILFNIVLIFLFDKIQTLTILLYVNLIITSILSIKFHKKKFIKFFIALFIIFNPILLKNLDDYSKKYEYLNQELIFQNETPLGNLIVTKTQEQLNFYENGILLFSSSDLIASEEIVHFPFSQMDSVKNVLCIAGGEPLLFKEIKKYKPRRIDYIEVNPYFVDLIKQYQPEFIKLDINTIIQDGRLFIKNTHRKYDIILINLPEPKSNQLNRYYTLEFLSLAKKTLTNQGIILLSLPSTVNYAGDIALEINSIMYNTLKEKFKSVLIVPASRNFYLASDKQLDFNFTSEIEKKNIPTVYVNKYYLDDETLKEKSKKLINSFASNKINTDFSPISYFLTINYWLSFFGDKPIYFLTFFILPFIYYLLKVNKINFILFSNGFAASATELLILAAFQVIYGYVYYFVGLIITLFMIGLAIGSFFGKKYNSLANKKHLIINQFIIIIFLASLPFLILLSSNFEENYIISIVFLCILMILMSFLIGMQFSIGTLIQKESITEISSRSFSSDLLGGALGALLVSAVMFPTLGLINTFLIVSAINSIPVIFKKW